MAFYKKTWFQISFIFLLAIIIFFVGLGRNYIYDWDEGIYAANALEMIKYHDPIVIRYNGLPDSRVLKFPLGVWLVAINFKIFGVTVWALRFWSALFSLLTVGVVYFLGRELKNRNLGLGAALIFMLSAPVVGWHAGRTGDFDAGLSFFVALSILSFILSYKRQRLKYFYGSIVAVGLGVMYKSFIAFLPLVIIGLFLLFANDKKRYLNWHVIIKSLIILAVIIFPWLIARELSGPGYLWQVIKTDYFSRLFMTLEGHYGSFWFYIHELKTIFYPWVIILPIAVLYLFKKIFLDKNKLASILLIWMAVILVLFSAASTKLIWYILPVYPAFSLVIAWLLLDIFEFLQRSPAKTKINLFYVLFLVLFMLLAIWRVEWYLRASSNQQGYFPEFLSAAKESGYTSDKLFVPQDFDTPSSFFYLQREFFGSQFIFYKIPICVGPINSLLIIDSARYEDYAKSCPEHQKLFQNNYFILTKLLHE